jgi:carbon storage regulator CsrA
MLVLSTRLNEKILLPDSKTSIEVVAIQSGTVRLGITAPEDVRILRENVPDRVAEWGPEPGREGRSPTIQDVKQLIDRRLEIARKGIHEANKCLRAGQDEEARVLLEKIDEDLHLLRRRVRREVEKAEAPCGLGI